MRSEFKANREMLFRLRKKRAVGKMTGREKETLEHLERWEREWLAERRP